MQGRAKRSYDLFVSYKKEDISLVRPVVDGLIASGVEAWFAEWRIFASDFEEFQDAIEQALPLARNALIFANARWLESPQCVREATALLARLPADKIVVVELGACAGVYERFPQLRQALVVPAANGKSSEEIFASIAALLGIAPSPSATRWLRKSDSYVPAMPLDKYGLKLDIEQVRHIPLGRIPLRPETFAGQYGLGEDEHGLRLYIACFSHSTAFGQIRELFDETPDLEAYDKLRSYAAEWTSLCNYQPKGLHYLTCGVGAPQGFTYCYDSFRGWNNYVWERRYIVYFGDEAGPKREVHFVFSKTYAQSGAPQDDERDFCSYTPLFERIVLSASLDPKAARMGCYAVGLACLKTLMAVAAVLAASAFTSAVTLFLAACLVTDAAVSWIDRSYRELQAMRWGRPMGRARDERCTPTRALFQGGLLHAPWTLFLIFVEVLLRSCAGALALFLSVLAFNHLIPEYALPVEQTRAVLPLGALATLVNWRRQVKAMKKVI